MPLPDVTASLLVGVELLRTQRLVEVGDPLSYRIDLAPVDPDAERAPVDLVFERKDAVGVNEDWDATGTERLVQPIRVVAATARAEYVVAEHQILNELGPDPAQRVVIRRSSRYHCSAHESATQNEVCLDALGPTQTAKRPSANQGVAVRPPYRDPRTFTRRPNPGTRAPVSGQPWRVAAEGDNRPLAVATRRRLTVGV